MMKFQLFHVKVFKAWVIVKLRSFEFFAADLAQDHYFWAFTFEMVFKLTSCHVHVLWKLTNVTSIFWAFIILRMFLQFPDSHPLDFSFRCFYTFMWIFAEINTVSENWIYFN